MELTLVDLCYDNVPSVTQETSDIEYTIPADTSGATATLGTSNIAQTTVTGCLITKTLELYDPVANTWGSVANAAAETWISTMSITGDTSLGSPTDSTGAISIMDDNTGSAYSNDRETVFELRWKNTDLRSKADGATVYDYFDVTIEWQCHDNTVTLGASGNSDVGEGIVDWSYELDNTARTKTLSYTELYTDCPAAITVACESAEDTSNTLASDWDWRTTGSEVTTCTLGGNFVI
jgi:hypothetical protein